jgi:hypothetical protein
MDIFASRCKMCSCVWLYRAAQLFYWLMAFHGTHIQ